MTESYEVYQAPGAATETSPAAPHGSTWQVAVEYASGKAKPPTKVLVRPSLIVDRDAALAEARREAFEFDPPDPYSKQRRTVYRDGPDGFLVVLQGAMTTFTMSVRIVQHLGGP